MAGNLVIAVGAIAVALDRKSLVAPDGDRNSRQHVQDTPAV